MTVNEYEITLPDRVVFCRQPDCFNRDMPIRVPCADTIVCHCGHPITETYSPEPPATPGVPS